MPGDKVTVTKTELRTLLDEALAANPPGKSVLSHEELEALASSVIAKTFIQMGIDPKQVFEMQKDFAFLRSLRNGSESLKAKALLTLLGTLVTAGISLIVMGLKGWFGGHK